MYIEKTKESLVHITDQAMKDQTMGLILQESAYYEMEVKNYQKSIQLLNQSQKYFNLNQSQDIAYFTANNQQLLGLNYYHLKEYKKSEEHYHKALEHLNLMPDNSIKGLVLNGLAEIGLAENDLEKAKINLEKAKALANQSDYLQLKKVILETSQKYYLAVKDFKKLSNSNAEHDSIANIINSKEGKFMDESFEQLSKENSNLKNESNSKDWQIFTILGSIALLLWIFIVYVRYKKRKFKAIKLKLKEWESRYANSLEPQESNEFIVDSEPIQIKESTVNTDEPKITMHEDTERRILQKLQKFEQSKLFNQKSISLSQLATYCETNPKYLSTVINSYKEKDFNNYINELRILFIIQKLKSEPKYLKYKIATMAEECGFSTASKFSIAFKKVVEVTPTEYMEFLKSEELIPQSE